MEPTFHAKQIIFVRRTIRAMRAGDVIVFKHDDLEKVKRVQSIVGENLYVVGDNPAASTDSRMFGAVPIACVLGRVIWPRH